jgi:hypothetical protein
VLSAGRRLSKSVNPTNLCWHLGPISQLPWQLGGPTTELTSEEAGSIVCPAPKGWPRNTVSLFTSKDSLSITILVIFGLMAAFNVPISQIGEAKACHHHSWLCDMGEVTNSVVLSLGL